LWFLVYFLVLFDCLLVDLSIEVYIVFYHYVFSLPAANINNPTSFGRITTSASAARELQFAVRYDF